MFNELDVVVLNRDLPTVGLSAGARGTVVHVFTKPSQAFEVEFSNDDGETLAMLTLEATQLAPAYAARKAA